MAAYCLVYDSRHLQADCQEPGSAPEPYARQSSTDYLYLFGPTAIPKTSNSHKCWEGNERWRSMLERLTSSFTTTLVSSPGRNDSAQQSSTPRRPAPPRSPSSDQSINVEFVGRRHTTRPGAPTVVNGKHDQKVHNWVVFWMYRCQ